MTIGTHCNPKSSSAELRAAAHEFCQSSPELAEARRSSPELKCIQSESFLNKVYVGLVWQKIDTDVVLEAQATCWCLWFGLGVLVDPILVLATKLSKLILIRIFGQKWASSKNKMKTR